MLLANLLMYIANGLMHAKQRMLHRDMLWNYRLIKQFPSNFSSVRYFLVLPPHPVETLTFCPVSCFKHRVLISFTKDIKRVKYYEICNESIMSSLWLATTGSNYCRSFYSNFHHCFSFLALMRLEL